VTVGGSAALIVGIIGAEVDYAFTPRFFDREEPIVPIVSSHVQTLTGNVLFTAPLSLTRESLRPYAVAGVGWMDVSAVYARLPSLSVDHNMVAFNVGGGAIGMLGNRTGLRFDLRRFMNIDRDIPAFANVGSGRVKFWRATVGVTLRY
jgi:hypothetical protein